MSRSQRKEWAEQTVEYVQRGTYTTPSGKAVSIADAVRDCLAATRLYSPNELAALDAGPPSPPGSVEVHNETTLEGIAQLVAHGPVAALNFASARNPGGGFLNGSLAQEESLARSSALHASQMVAWDFYEQHRAMASCLYSDAMILSPGCPIIRDDAGELLDEPRLATFITSAAPNKDAMDHKRDRDVKTIPEVFRRRIGYVLALALAHGIEQLVLGAWGCGVFRNDPAVVAEAFAFHLQGKWAGQFKRVRFSVFDPTPALQTLKTFERALS